MEDYLRFVLEEINMNEVSVKFHFTKDDVTEIKTKKLSPTYISILEALGSETMIAPKISEGAKYPINAIYEVLRRLKTKGLITAKKEILLGTQITVVTYTKSFSKMEK